MAIPARDSKVNGPCVGVARPRIGACFRCLRSKKTIRFPDSGFAVGGHVDPTPRCETRPPSNLSITRREGGSNGRGGGGVAPTSHGCCGRSASDQLLLQGRGQGRRVCDADDAGQNDVFDDDICGQNEAVQPRTGIVEGGAWVRTGRVTWRRGKDGAGQRRRRLGGRGGRPKADARRNATQGRL